MSSEFFAGLDWAVHTHAVCVIDTAGSVRDRLEIAHDRQGQAELMRRLACFGASVRIAIERPSGLIVDALVEAGHEVFPIHPNAVKASRPRYRSHGAKSDASDAYLLADLLRTDGHRWRALAPQSDDIRALRALVRSRDDLVAARVAAANQLSSTLQAFWPGAAQRSCWTGCALRPSATWVRRPRRPWPRSYAHRSPCSCPSSIRSPRSRAASSSSCTRCPMAC